MNLLELCNLQGSLFLMILAGAILKRRGIISKEGEKCLTDLCVNIVIPCNIVKSCLISFDASIFKTCGKDIEGITGQKLYDGLFYNQRLGRDEYLITLWQKRLVQRRKMP